MPIMTTINQEAANAMPVGRFRILGHVVRCFFFTRFASPQFKIVRCRLGNAMRLYQKSTAASSKEPRGARAVAAGKARRRSLATVRRAGASSPHIVWIVRSRRGSGHEQAHYVCSLFPPTPRLCQPPLHLHYTSCCTKLAEDVLESVYRVISYRPSGASHPAPLPGVKKKKT